MLTSIIHANSGCHWTLFRELSSKKFCSGQVKDKEQVNIYRYCLSVKWRRLQDPKMKQLYSHFAVRIDFLHMLCLFRSYAVFCCKYNLM